MPTMKDSDVRLELRVPRDLADALAAQATQQERSLNRQANLLLRQALGLPPAMIAPRTVRQSRGHQKRPTP